MESIKDLWDEGSWRQAIIGICVAALLVIVGIYFESFYLRLIGIVAICVNLPYVVISPFVKYYFPDSFGPASLGCCVFPIIITLLAFFFSTERYISGHNGQLHLYEDCSTFKHTDKIKKVSKFEGLFMLNFKECDVCKDRKEKEKKLEMEKQEEDRKRQRLEGLLRMRELNEFDDSLNRLIEDFEG